MHRVLGIYIMCYSIVCCMGYTYRLRVSVRHVLFLGFTCLLYSLTVIPWLIRWLEGFYPPLNFPAQIAGAHPPAAFWASRGQMFSILLPTGTCLGYVSRTGFGTPTGLRLSSTPYYECS